MEMTASDYSHLRDYTEDLTLSCPLATQSIRKGLTRWVKEVGVGGVAGALGAENACSGGSGPRVTQG